MGTATALDEFAHRSGRDIADGAAGFARARRQWLDVSGRITDRLLVTFRAPAAGLAPLVPAPFELDAFAGQGFVSVCVLEVIDMGIDVGPRWLRFTNRELLYRVGIRFRDRPTFLTLRSDTASPMLAALGGPFSHYGLRRADIAFSRRRDALSVECRTRDGKADAQLCLGTVALREKPASTVFDGVDHAAERLIGMSFSVGVTERGRVLAQDIEHDPWHPEFVGTDIVRFDHLDALARDLGIELEYDNTLAVHDVHQTWRAARWVP